MKLFQKANFFSEFWQTGKKGCLSHTHRPKCRLTAFESFGSEKLKKT
jgi:hypothetical protein